MKDNTGAESKLIVPQRRLFLQHSAAAIAVAGSVMAGSRYLQDPQAVDPNFAEPGRFAEALSTPPQAEGPFPVRGAMVEIWQCDGNGIYHHARGGDRNKLDTNFQSFGRFRTNLKGEYYFRTIKPVSYPGRAPHVHFLVYTGGKKQLTTQMYIKGHALNGRDGLLNSVGNVKQREMLIVDFQPLAGSKLKELTANFDIVIGTTPEDASSS